MRKKVRTHHVREVACPGDNMTLFSTTSQPVLEIPELEQLGLDDIEVRQGILARFQGGAPRTCTAPRSARRAFRNPGPTRGLARSLMRPGTGQRR